MCKGTGTGNGTGTGTGGTSPTAVAGEHLHEHEHHKAEAVPSHAVRGWAGCFGCCLRYGIDAAALGQVLTGSHTQVPAQHMTHECRLC